MAKNKSAFKSGSGVWLWLGIALLTLLLDQLTKIAVVGAFQLGEALPITSFFNLVRVHNPGAAFSFLADAGGWQRWFFTGLGIVAAGVMLYNMLTGEVPRGRFRPASEMSLRSPGLPSAFTRNLGTTKSEIPFTPGISRPSGPGTFASTR